ncbi:MAG TPA: EAL domain-containing protein [Solirubrobacteraceae bacterium]|nr:EAL domain-containing protein [Solirubrobacteraceae bacterium]
MGLFTRIEHASWLRTRAWQLYLVFGGIGTALYALVPPFAGSGPVINTLGMSGVVAVMVGVRMHRPKSRLPWWLFALGLFLFWLGDVYTYSYPRLFHADVPFPSAGDAIYLCVYPVLMAGLLLLVRRRNPEGDRAGLIDSLIMTLGLSLVSWIALIAPYVHDNTMSLVPKLVSIAYPIGDILLLAAAVRLAVDTGRRQPSFYLLALSIVTLLVTDFVYGLLTLDNAYTHQVILDVGWIFFYLFWGAAALHPSMRELEQPAPERQPRLTHLRLMLLTAAVLVAPAIEIIKELRRNDLDLIITIAVSGILFALVVVRMAGLVRQRERSIAQERILAAAAGEIMATTSRSQICNAALAAVPSLVEEAAIARLCFIEEDRVEAVGPGSGPANESAHWSLDPHVFGSLAPSGSYRGHERALTDDQRSGLRFPAETATALVVELPQRSDRRTRGLLLVAGDAARSRSALSALVALATQVSLALESNALTEELHRRASEARFRSLVQHTHDLITVLDSNAHVIYQSPSIEHALGYSADEIIGTRFDRLLPPGENSRLVHLLADGPTYAGGDAEVIECSLRHRDGSTRHFEILHTNLLDDEAVGGIVLNGRDISERKAFEAQLEHQAFHDPVTKLANRALFNERVRHALARARREHFEIAVIFLDLDDFKTINDSLGHAAGDRVLLEVSKRLATSVRVSDTVARFGGDEFAILLEDTNGPQEAAEIAERIVELLKTPLRLEEKEIVVQASLGISVVDFHSTVDADELIRNADAAMYIAKRDGKGTYRLFEPEMHAEVLARLELRADLQRALVNDEFELYYQPVIRLGDSTISGVEALVRWHHPERGVIGPTEFIPFAEETGLIIPIGRWVLREGCRQAKLIQDVVPTNPPLSMNVNISAVQLHHSDIVGDVRDALSESGLPPDNLTLEITETAMMTNADLAEERLSELKELGVSIALDDFGTGYSSLGYLARFPVDVIKMDRSFLVAGASPVTSGLATAVIGLGKTFDLHVVAEGIEFPEQWSTLRELGCELGQGFYFARPMNATGTIEYLQTHPDLSELAGNPHPNGPDRVDAT